MIKMIAVLLAVAFAIYMFGYYLVESDKVSKVKFIKWLGIGTVCLALAVVVLSSIVVLF